MAVSSFSPTIMLGPGIIGFVVATFLYGIEVCQFVFYLRAFPYDQGIVKLQVYTIAVLDTAHFFSIIPGFYQSWIACRRSTSSACIYHVPWIVILSISLVYCTTFLVQVFYAHRVWIISSRNMKITLVVLVFATLQLLFGLMVIYQVIQKPTNQVMFSSRYTPMSSTASAVCDAIITLSVMYYLRPRSIRRVNFIRKLLVVFVEMGLFTCINALLVVVLYYIQTPLAGHLTIAPGVILSKSYVNSMLAVLNARKPIRDEQENDRVHSFELPTISTTAPPHDVIT